MTTRGKIRKRFSLFFVLGMILSVGSVFPMMNTPVYGDEKESDTAQTASEKQADNKQQVSETEFYLTAKDAENAIKKEYRQQVQSRKEKFEKDWNDKIIRWNGKEMPILYRTFGKKPEDGWNLYISMHGGGNAPAPLNNQQWMNQFVLYAPENSLYVAPRAPSNTWNLWHEDHIDNLFDELIQGAIAIKGVNPNRVYIMGYSAGGDGVFRLAPRMADRWAAAAMMAGHPGDENGVSLRNLPFALYVGGLDAAYDRNKLGSEWKDKLDKFQKDDPEGYPHQVVIYPNKAHWMDREDAVALDYMKKATRKPFPSKIVWEPISRPHSRFYWVEVPEDELVRENRLVAVLENSVLKPEKEMKTKNKQQLEGQQQIVVEEVRGFKHLTFLLNDSMFDLDQPITVVQKLKDGTSKVLFNGKVQRNSKTLNRSLETRLDPQQVFYAEISVEAH